MEQLIGTPIFDADIYRLRPSFRLANRVPANIIPNLTWYPIFSTLPPEVQLAIIKQVERKTLVTLCLVNKHFFQLCFTEIYSRVDLFSHYAGSGKNWGLLALARAMVRERQNQYCATIESHPEFAALTRTLLWQAHKKTWDVLALMPRLRHIRLDGINAITEPVPVNLAMRDGTDMSAMPTLESPGDRLRPLYKPAILRGPEHFPWSNFSCLETVSFSGSYVTGALTGILLNSPRLKELSLKGGTGEFSAGDAANRSIVPVLDACVALPCGFPNLRWLELERHVHLRHERLDKLEDLAVQAWCRFLSRFGGQLGYLALRVGRSEPRLIFEDETAFKRYILPLFTGGTFATLKSLTLEGFSLSAEDETAVRRGLPSDVVITQTPNRLYL